MTHKQGKANQLRGSLYHIKPRVNRYSDIQYAVGQSHYFSDLSMATNVDSSTQLGHIIFIHGEDNIFVPIYFKS